MNHINREGSDAQAGRTFYLHGDHGGWAFKLESPAKSLASGSCLVSRVLRQLVTVRRSITNWRAFQVLVLMEREVFPSLKKDGLRT